MNLRRKPLLLLYTVCSLGACGGATTDSPSPVPVPAPIPVPTPAPAPSPGPSPDPVGFPENFSFAILTPSNYKIALSRAYRTLVDGSVYGYVGNGPDPNSETCSSGTQGYRLVDGDGDGRPSKGDEVEKTYAACTFAGLNGSQRVDGTVRYVLMTVTASGSATQWQLRGNFKLADKTSDPCTSAGQCFVAGGGEYVRTRSGEVTTIAMDGGPQRYDWLGSSDAVLSALSSSFETRSMSGRQLFASMFNGSVCGKNLFGPAVSQGKENCVALNMKTNSAIAGDFNANGGYASSGQLQLDGRSNTARVSAGVGSVKTELDADGDGVFEVTETVQWSTFASL